jgi:DNA-directed RNA polymerase subunit RPC12/RpoP
MNAGLHTPTAREQFLCGIGFHAWKYEAGFSARCCLRCKLEQRQTLIRRPVFWPWSSYWEEIPFWQDVEAGASVDNGVPKLELRNEEAICLDFEVVPAATMFWKCLDCHAKFEGPTDRDPPNGCAVCGSHNVFDINVSFAGFAPLREASFQERALPIREV